MSMQVPTEARSIESLELELQAGKKKKYKQ